MRHVTHRCFRRLALLLTACMLLCGLPVLASGSYTDVPPGIWYEASVERLRQEKVITGYPDGTFRPDNHVTVGEALKLVLLTAGYPEQPALAGQLWSAGYAQFALEQGFVLPEYVADLNAPMPRVIVAQMAAKALGIPACYDKSPFADTENDYVVALYQQEILQGSFVDGVRVFLPRDGIKRSEVSAILCRMMDWQQGLLPEKPEEPDAPVEPEIPDQPDMPDAPEETFVYNGHVLPLFSEIPQNTYDADAFVLQDGVMTYGGDDAYVRLGIDVSHHQGEIDWQQVADFGVEFVMLRLGYRGYTAGNLLQDVQFRENMEGALEAGLQVGVYVFSQALNEAEALEEAQFALDKLAPYEITGPVVWDWEVIGKGKGRADDLDSDTLGACANLFCQTVADAGYTPMVYFNTDVGYFKYDLRDIAGYDWWYAGYTAAPRFRYDFDVWQYTDSGSVPGISGKVDMDLWFVKE